MSEPARKRRGPITLFCESRRFRWVVLWVALLPALYLASLGPASWLVDRDIVPYDAARLFYEPLCMTIARCPAHLRSSAIKYCELFALPKDGFLLCAGRRWILVAGRRAVLSRKKPGAE